MFIFCLTVRTRIQTDRQTDRQTDTGTFICARTHTDKHRHKRIQMRTCKSEEGVEDFEPDVGTSCLIHLHLPPLVCDARDKRMPNRSQHDGHACTADECGMEQRASERECGCVGCRTAFPASSRASPPHLLSLPLTLSREREAEQMLCDACFSTNRARGAIQRQSRGRAQVL